MDTRRYITRNDALLLDDPGISIFIRINSINPASLSAGTLHARDRHIGANLDTFHALDTLFLICIGNISRTLFTSSPNDPYQGCGISSGFILFPFS